MAKKLRSEDLVLNVIVNGDQGRAEMQKLERQITDLGTANERLEQKQRKLEAAGKSGSQAWLKNKAAIDSNNAAIQMARDRLEQLRKGLDLTNMSIRDLQREQGRLLQLLRNATPGTENFAKYSAQLKQVNTRLLELNGKAKSTGLSLCKVADGLNRYIGIVTAGFATFAMFVSGARAAGNAYAQLDDKVADVMKTTGLAREVVYDMNESLSKVDTRTAQLELLGLAQQAGKLGISARRDVEDFVLAADKIGVALGEDLGDKDEVIRQIGKIVDLFKVKEEFGMGDGMLKVGSVINASGAASTANEGYIVDFTKRLGGIAVPAKMSVTQVAGLGATLDALGQTSEASSTAVGQVLTGMFRKTSEYAKVAGMDVKAFKKLMTEDINEAFIKVLEGMQGGGLDRVVAMLGDLGENGARVTTALGTLASNTQKLREQQALANDEFVKGTSVLNEYETKNNSAQAVLEKAQKSFQKRLVELGKSLQPLMTYTTTGFATVVKVFKEYKDIIVSAAIAVGAYVVVAKAYALWTTRATTGTLLHTAALKARIIWEKATVAAMQLHLAMSALLTGSLKTARIAMLAFAKATLLSPAGIIVTLTAIIYAVTKLGKSYDAAARSAKDMSDVTVKAGDSYMSEKVKLEQLLKIASDKAASDQARKKAIKELQAAIPNGIDLINEETIATGKAKKAVDDYCDSLMLQAKLEAAKEKLIEIEKERLKALENGERTNVSSWQFIKAVFTTNTLSDYVEENKREFDERYDHRQSRMSAYIEDLYRELADQEETKNILGNGNNPTTNDTDGGDDKAKDWSLDNDEAFMGKKIVLKRKLWQGEIATEAEYNRRLFVLEIQTLEKRIAANKEKGTDLAKLEEQLLDKHYQQHKAAREREQKLRDIASQGDSAEDKENDAYEKQLRDLGFFGRELDAMTADEQAAYLQLKRTHYEKLSALYIDPLSKELASQQKAIQRKATALKQSHNDELAAATTFEQKKALLAQWYSAEKLRRIVTDKQAEQALQKHYAAEEQAAMKEDLEQMLTIYQSVVKEVGETGFISEGVKATEEDIGKLLDIIAELEAKLAEYKKKNPKNSENETSDETATDLSSWRHVDILGMSGNDWKELFEHIKAGNIGLDETYQIVTALGNAFGEVSKLMAAMEQRDLKAFTRSQEKRKKAIENRVKAGQLSEEQAAAATQKIDEETEARTEELQNKQAKREKALGAFNITISTAVAVAKALEAGAFIGPILAGVIAAMGAVQLATLLATPLPGAEKGGLLIERQQDGKRYRAGYDPDRRGPVDRPTVLVGENGTEYVVPAEGYENPTIRPVLDIMERARRSGTIREINLPAALAAAGAIPGRAAGGYMGDNPLGAAMIAGGQVPTSSAAYDAGLLRELCDTVGKLSRQLDKPILAQVAMAGDKGLARQLERYNKTVNASRL